MFKKRHLAAFWSSEVLYRYQNTPTRRVLRASGDCPRFGEMFQFFFPDLVSKVAWFSKVWVRHEGALRRRCLTPTKNY